MDRAGNFIKNCIVILVCILLPWLIGYMKPVNPDGMLKNIFEVDEKIEEDIAGFKAYLKNVKETEEFVKEDSLAASNPIQEEPEEEVEADEMEEEETSGEPSFEKNYYYSYLSESMQVLYEEIYDGLINREEITLSTLSEESMEIAFQSVLSDNPEIFDVSGYHFTKHSWSDELVKITFKGQYDMTEEEAEEYRPQIDTYVDKCLASMPQGLDQYGKVKYVFEYIIEHTTYNLEAPNNQNICSVFVSGESVCQGYAEAAQYLLKKLGFQITVVPGTVENGARHAWNLILVDGAYYYLDVTWGDVDYQAASGNNQGVDSNVMTVNYDYFLITTEQLLKTHQIDSIVPMPACVTLTNNYYVREGLYFETLDSDKLEQVFADSYANGKENVTIKCSNAELFIQMKQYLLEEQNIFQYIKTVNTIAYCDDEQAGTLCFWLN